MRDHRFGHIVTQDLASYHFASHADEHASPLSEEDSRAIDAATAGT